MERDRDDKAAEAEALIAENALKKHGNRMSVEDRSSFIARLHSAEGQLRSTKERIEAQRRADPSEGGIKR